MFKKILLVLFLLSGSVFFWLTLPIENVSIYDREEKEVNGEALMKVYVQRKLLVFEEQMEQLKKQQAEKESLLEEEIEQSKKQQARKVGFLEEEVEQLKKKQAEKVGFLEEEIEQLKKQQAGKKGFLEEEIVSTPFDRKQKIQEAKIVLGNTVDKLNGFLGAEMMDEVRASDLQGKVQSAFSNTKSFQEAVLTSAMCSVAVCRFEIFSHPSVESNGQSVMAVLQEKDIFGDSEVLVIPDEASGKWTFYVSPEGQHLPRSRDNDELS